MSEERNRRDVFEGGSLQERGSDRRKALRRKTDIARALLKLLAVALIGALLIKLFGK